MTYKKPRKLKATVTIEAPKAPSLANTLINKVTSAFAPLNKFQQALYYTANIQKPSKIGQWFKKHRVAIAIVEKVVFLLFAIYALFSNPYLLLVLPATGGLIYYRNRVKWLWWKVKVFVLYRNYYQHRRQLYKMGSLYHHFSVKQPKRYGTAIIWGESSSVQDIKFRKLQKNKNLTSKEYILS